MKVVVLTLGCRVNQSESAVIEGSLKERGLSVVAFDDNPDVCIINTCTVTAKSDYQSRQLIRKAVKGGSRVIVTGCYAQLRQDEVRAMPGMIEFVENTRKYEIVRLLTGRDSDIVFSDSRLSRPPLKVQDGCNFRCSYCSVPLARGRSRSVPLAEALTRVKAIETAGYNEVVLTGIHLGSYGQDIAVRTNLKELIKKILQRTDIKRIRLSSIEVSEIDDELIDLLQDSRLCSHIHVPLQSGNNKILRLMRRNYTLSEYSSKIHKILSKVGNIALGSDIIVGFPGEEDEEFACTYDFLKSNPFSYLHIFPFSSRPGTEAYSMKQRVRGAIIKERLDILAELNKEKRQAYLHGQLNCYLDIIVEEINRNGCVSGTSGNYIKVSMPMENAKKGSIVFARILRAFDNHLEGAIINA